MPSTATMPEIAAFDGVLITSSRWLWFELLFGELNPSDRNGASPISLAS
jgi:hypothetical protein